MQADRLMRAINISTDIHIVYSNSTIFLIHVIQYPICSGSPMTTARKLSFHVNNLGLLERSCDKCIENLRLPLCIQVGMPS